MGGANTQTRAVVLLDGWIPSLLYEEWQRFHEQYKKISVTLIKC